MLRVRLVLGVAVVATPLVMLVLVLGASELDAVTVSTTVPVHGQVFDDCTGEFVDVAGSANLVSRSTARPNGSYEVGSHLNWQGVSGIGETTGDTYHGVAASNFASNVAAGSETTIADKFMLVSAGSAPNLQTFFLLHLTVAPDGTVKTVVDHLRFDCRA